MADTKAVEQTPPNTNKTTTINNNNKKKKNRRRRNKKDVVLDFRKTSIKKREDGQAEVMTMAEFYKKEAGKRKGSKGKITLTTSSKDYDGNLGLPEQITQREFETTGQFFKRIDRLLAKARVEANLESRFDMTLPKEKKNCDAIVGNKKD